MRIATAADLFGTTTAEQQHVWLMAQRAVRQQRAVLGVAVEEIGRPDDIDLEAAPAVALVNHARWIADCPTAGCPGAAATGLDLPFMCPNCLNVETGHRYRSVLWPAERTSIEAALGGRLLPEQANWSPGETVADLLTENAKGGDL